MASTIAVFKPKDKAELQGAVNAWIQNPANASIDYGAPSTLGIPR
jgi:hypothetical protein